MLVHEWLCATLWTVAHQASMSMGFSRHEYWSGWPCSPPRDLLHPGIKSANIRYWQADFYSFFRTNFAVWTLGFQSKTRVQIYVNFIYWHIFAIYNIYNPSMCAYSVMFNCLWSHVLYPTKLPCQWNFPSKNWSGLPFPPPKNLPDTGIKFMSPASPALTGNLFTTEPLC